MKNYITYSIGFIAFLMHLSSCSESVLVTNPTDRYIETNWWQNEDQAVGTLNGIYSSVSATNDHNTILYGISPNVYANGNAVSAGTHDASNVDEFRNKWISNYSGIGRVNYFLKNVENVEFNDVNNKERIKGEAFFLRALFYHNLVTFYGGVPLILDPPDISQSNLPRDSRETVVGQIVNDLDNAISRLPNTNTSGRATKGSTLTLKARVQLYEGNWVEAAESAKMVMDSKVYSLVEDYREIFTDENESNSEVIFEIQHKLPESGHSMESYIGDQQNLVPTLDLVNSYYMLDGLPSNESPLFDAADPYSNRDPRLHKTVVFPGSKFNGEIVDGSEYYFTGLRFKKYSGYHDEVKKDEIIKRLSTTNFIVMRYADVLLMYAEAANENGGPSESVYAAINQVRARAGMPNVAEGLSKDELRDEIRHERRVELALEQLYYNDIRRWKTAGVVMNSDVYGLLVDAPLEHRVFNENRDYLWPIHNIELINNPALEQNPGY